MMLRMIARLLALAVLPTLLGAAAKDDHDFACRNEAAEIRCAEGRCEVLSDGFTPMELHREGKKLSLCAYSGCWDGAIRFSRRSGGLEILYADVKSPTEPGFTPRPLAVIHDPESRTAQMRWSGFANTMTCTR